MELGRDGKGRVWGRDMGQELDGRLVQVLGGMELGGEWAWVGDKGRVLVRGQAWVHDKERERVWDGKAHNGVLLRISHRQHIHFRDQQYRSQFGYDHQEEPLYIHHELHRNHLELRFC